MSIGVGISSANDPVEAGRRATASALESLSGQRPSVAFVFFSSRYASYGFFNVLKDMLKDTFIGCSTAGEILDGPYEKSVVVVVLSSPYVEAHVCQVRIGQDLGPSISELLDKGPVRLARDPGFWKEISKEGKQAFGVLFSPGNTKSKDSPAFQVFQSLQEKLPEGFPIVGACAADDWGLNTNFVVGPEGLEEYSIGFALITTSLRFGIGMFHGFVPTNRHAMVTKSHGNTILELNGQPAVETAQWLFQAKVEDLEGRHIGLSTKQLLGIPDRFGNFIVVTPSYLTREGGMRTSQPIYPGTRVYSMVPSPDISGTARQAFSRALSRAGSPYPDLGLIFSCAMQWKMVGEEKRAEEISLLKTAFGRFPVAGFYSFGEQGITLEGARLHLNGAVSTLAVSDELTHGARIYLDNKALIGIISRKNQEIQQAASEWEATFDAAPMNITIIDRNFRITRANKAMAECLKIPKEELIGKVCFELVHKSNGPPPGCPLKEVLEDGVPRFGEIYEPKLGGWVLLGVAPIRDPLGHVTKAISFALNINEKKLLEQAQDRIKKLEVSSTIAGGIAHDFNNLLMIVLGSIELAMLEIWDRPKASKNLLNARDAVGKMADLIKRLIFASSKASINPVLTDIIGIMKRAVQNKTMGSHVNVHFSFEEIGPINIDPFFMTMAIENIIENAVEAMEGRGEILVQARPVFIRANEVPGLKEGTYVEITVEDTGKGIHPEDLGRIFDPYYTTKQRSHIKGMGLGLAEAFGILRSHKGTITVESELGKGTKVRLYLPSGA